MASSGEHRAIATTAKGILEEINVATAEPGQGEVRIKMHYAALIPFDTYQLDRGYMVLSYPLAVGFSGSGVVDAIGTGVTSLKVGDKVTAMTFPSSKNKSLQEYAIVNYSAAAKIPDDLPLDEAASLSDNFVTAFWTLFGPNLKLPHPSTFPASAPPADADAPILVYGAGASAGQYTVQLLKLAGYKNIFAVASAHNHAHLKSLGASHAFDYRSASFVDDILAAAGGKIKTVVDIIAARPSLDAIHKIVAPGAKVAILLPVKEGETVTNAVESEMFGGDIPEAVRARFEGVELIPVATFKYQADEYVRENLMPKILPELLAKGLVKPNRIRLLKEGTLKERVEIGLDLLRNNKISGEKVVVDVLT